MEDKMTENEKLTLLADVGQLLLSNGSDSMYVESEVEDISKLLDYPVTCSVNLTTVIISSVDTPGAKVVKTELLGFNLQTVEDVNALYHQLKEKNITLDDFLDKIKNEKTQVKEYPFKYKLLSAGLVSLPASLVGTSHPLDFISMAFAAIVSFYIYSKVKKNELVPYSSEFVGGVLVGFIALSLHLIDTNINYFSVVLGGVMPFVPGLALTNAISEIIVGDFIAGLIRSIQATLIVVSLAAGVSVGIEIIQFIM